MRLIENWRQSWKMISMIALSAIAGLQSVIAVMPEAMLTEPVPVLGISYVQVLVRLTILAAIIGAVGRVLKQASIASRLPDEGDGLATTMPAEFPLERR